MAYLITGTVTYASQANRDAAVARVNTAVAAYNFINKATTITAGITTSGTTIINISIETTTDGGDYASTVKNVIYNALTSTNRHTSGWVSVIKV